MSRTLVAVLAVLVLVALCFPLGAQEEQSTEEESAESVLEGSSVPLIRAHGVTRLENRPGVHVDWMEDIYGPSDPRGEPFMKMLESGAMYSMRTQPVVESWLDGAEYADEQLLAMRNSLILLTHMVDAINAKQEDALTKSDVKFWGWVIAGVWVVLQVLIVELIRPRAAPTAQQLSASEPKGRKRKGKRK